MMSLIEELNILNSFSWLDGEAVKVVMDFNRKHHTHEGLIIITDSKVLFICNIKTVIRVKYLFICIKIIDLQHLHGESFAISWITSDPQNSFRSDRNFIQIKLTSPD